MEAAMSTQHDQLAKLLRKLRLRAGLSVKELEVKSGVSRAAISRTENGEKLPTPTTLNRLAEGLGIDASELFQAAGYTTTGAEALPALQPYLRAKYAHLPAAARKELADYLDRLEAEYGSPVKPTSRSQARKTH